MALALLLCYESGRISTYGVAVQVRRTYIVSIECKHFNTVSLTLG
jgi:hypothetical protein